MQGVITSVVTAIRTNSRTIGQLTPISTLSDNDMIEISGGRKISFGDLKTILDNVGREDLDILTIKVNKNTQAIKELSAGGTQGGVTTLDIESISERTINDLLGW